MPGKKLLVADDSLTIQKVIRLALSNEGYEIQAVSDGNDAVQQMNLFHPDVVLIDVSLPGKSAFEVKREVNGEPDLTEIRFVLMSSAFERVDEAQAEEVKFHGRLTKPFDPAHLRQVLTEVLTQTPASRSDRSTDKTSLLTQSQLEASVTPPPPPDALPEDEVTLPVLPSLEAANLDEWETTLKPEFPTLPAPPSPETHALWEPSENPHFPGEDLPGPPPPFLHPPSFDKLSLPIESQSFSEETDIRALTESTMRITGMDDFQWSVKEPSTKPFPEMTDREEKTFELAAPAEFNSQNASPTSPPIDLPYLTNEKKEEPLSHSPLSVQQMERIISQQVEATLTKLAQGLLPGIAEKIIKQEIHRLLSE